jgi:hypothetical protein
MKIKITLLSLVAIATIGAGVAIMTSQIRFTVHVIGEDGAPLAGVKTSVIFHPNASRQDQITQINVISDENGNFTAEGPSQDGTFGVGQLLSKDGYYGSGVNIPYFVKTDDHGHWLPWDQTYTTMMRKIGNPIPMYAKTVGVEIPAVGIPCGYDLEVGDWVGPYGKGKVADFIVTITNRRYVSWYDFDVNATITFPNPGDGIQETKLPKEFANSQFKWPRLAPETGYQSSLDARIAWFPQSSRKDPIDTNSDTQDYFFRVRTAEQSGNVTSALYGKISGGIGIDPRKAKVCGLGFTYYLNPNINDRNIEYGSTLFKKLAFLETPRAP